jgi:uncharacterized protein (TIGR02444 family)
VRFWDWAVDVWRRPGVEPLCLELQDEHLQSIPYLLWAAWAASAGRRLTDEQLHTGAEIAKVWEEDVIGHLRAARRALRPPADGQDTPGFEDLRRQVRSAEISAERLLVESLELMTPTRAQDPEGLEPALVRATLAFGRVVPAALLESLAARLPG